MVPSSPTVPVAISLPTTSVPWRLKIGRAATTVLPLIMMSNGARNMNFEVLSFSQTIMPR